MADMGNDSSNIQTQQQQQLSTRQEEDVELLKDQLDSIFEVMDQFLNYLKSGNPTQNQLLSRADLAISMLKVYGNTCESSRQKQETNTLIATWSYFKHKSATMNPIDAKILKNWLNYMKYACVSDKKLKPIRISKQTILLAEKNWNSANVNSLMSGVVGANHVTQKMVENVKTYHQKYLKANIEAIKTCKNEYMSIQKTIKQPSNLDMYSAMGGGANIEIAKAPFFSESKDNDNDSVMKGNNDSGITQQINNLNLNDNAPQSQGTSVTSPFSKNFLVMNGAPIVDMNKKPVLMFYPFPCQLIEEFNDGIVGVMYAWPYNDIRKKLPEKKIERDPVKVSRGEQEYMQKTGCQDLGYKSMEQIQRLFQ